MEFKDVALKRKSIRKYKNEAVSLEILKEIMELGITAPSATNLQHWYFVVVCSPEKRAVLDRIMKGTADAILPCLNGRFPNHPDVIKETYAFTSTLGNAPVCVLAFLQKEYENRDDAIQSVSAALENIFLAAVDKGLGGCWLTAPVDSGKSEDLRLAFAPDKGEFVAMLTLGYPEDENTSSPKRKDGRYTFV